MAKRNIYLMLTLALSVLLVQCKSKKMMQQTDALKAKAEEIFGTGYQILNNKDQTYALVFKEIKTRPNQIFPSVKFFIYQYDIAEDFYHQGLSRGSVVWISNHEIRCESIPGRVTGDQGKKRYIYNVLTRTSQPLRSK